MFLEQLHRLQEAPLPSPLQKRVESLITYCESLDPEEVDPFVFQIVVEATVIISCSILAFVITLESGQYREAILASIATFLIFLGVDVFMFHPPKDLDTFMQHQIFLSLSQTFPFSLLQGKEEAPRPKDFPWNTREEAEERLLLRERSSPEVVEITNNHDD